MKKTLLLDVDGVLADCGTPVHRFAERLLRRALPGPTTWTSWDHGEAMGMTQEENRFFHQEIKRSDVAFEIGFYEGAEESVHKLRDAFDVVFVTADWKWFPAWVSARHHLLDNFGCDVVFTHSKHRVLGSFLCDDKALTCETGGPWEAILFDRPWNHSSPHPTRVKALDELLNYK